MKPVILLRRAGIEKTGFDLVKAARGHKYWKREPYFVGGKLRYRYYYNTPADRERWAKEHDPSGEHTHHVKGEEHKHHASMMVESKPTASLNAEVIQQIMEGMSTRGGVPKVHISARFERAHKQPFVDAEEGGRPVERNPIQRVAKALDMLPDAVRELVTIKSLKITTRSDPYVRKQFERGDPPRPAPAAFSDREGNVVLCADGEAHAGRGAGFNVHPSGWPRFGSPLTSSEETVWREVGRQLRYAIASKRKDAWKEWQDLSSSQTSGDAKLSAFAMQNADHDFMETFACALSHPKQLAQQAPDRYEFMRKHGLADLPPLSEMLSKPDGELSWWEGAKETGGRKLLAEKMQDEPTGTPYQSPKDEFFQVSMGGRTVYLRVGPGSPDEEDNWETMPETIDPETGYPIYDKDVAIRFRAKEAIKEIYDQHGNRLTDEAAFLFLNQDKDITKFNAATMNLGYLMYDGLGSSRGDAAKERAAIKKMEAKGQDPADKRGDRWGKVPHKISEAEFLAKTPSFAFGKTREAKSQPYVKLQDGKPVMHINPQTGKEEPQLTARVYESVNPDGSVAKMAVMESPSFEYGDTVLLPVTTFVKDEETGETFERVQEQEVTLDPTEHPDISPEGLSKQFKTPVDELLQRNNKFRQFQLIDPMMAALINPSGVPIKDRATLMQLLTAAADAQPEIWTTVAYGSDPISRAHVKVKFDGGGSPVLVGAEWARKLGKDVPRVSDLMSNSGQVKHLEKVKPREPRRRKIKENGFCRFKDKESGKWMFARVLEKNTSGGKRRYQIQPMPGQGVSTEPMEVRSVRRVTTDMDPERPDIHVAEFSRLQSSVLVHVDEQRKDSEGRLLPGTGKLKIKLPKDGSWNFETMARVEGVKLDEESGELILDPTAIDAFREAVGSFAMDEEAERRMHRIKSVSKAEAEAGRSGRTPMTDLVDPTNGNAVNTQKLLKGVRKRLANGAEFKLGSHQAELLKAMADNDGRILAAHFMGTGKTVSAICAIKMMQNLETEDGEPHPNRPKRVAVVVPKNTAQQWVSAVSTFTEGRATLVGTDLAGAVEMPTPPAGFDGWSDEKKQAWHDEQTAKDPGLWRPDEDDTDIVIISQEYFTRHADELKRIGGFDGMIVDEAHGIQAGGKRDEGGTRKGNNRAKKVEEWNPDMKMMMLLTGTPVTNRLTTLTNYMKILSNDEIDLGTEEEFRDQYLIESAVQKANGTKTAEKMDLNPQMMGKLQKLMKPYVHVATTADVKGKTIPAVSLDENSPAAMGGIQSMLYRGYMDQLSAEDKALLEMAATLGEDERGLLDPEAQAKVLVARNITNSPAYKPKDGRKFVTFTETEPPKGKKKKGKKKTVEFSLPGWDRFQKDFGGRFPSADHVARGKLSHEEYVAMQKWIGHALDRDYGDIEGKKLMDVLSSEEMTDLRKGNPMSGGLQFGQKVANPEYGPEGAQARGVMGSDGRIKPIEHVIRNADGSVKEVIKVPVGLRFVRGKDAQYFMGGLPDEHPLSGEFESDWDFTKGDPEALKGAKVQKPKKGREDMSVTRSPERRRERLMFDLTMTTGNAKCDELERYMGDKLDPSKGGNPDAQMILFGGVYPSLRTMESKLRTMGYKDVNEVLNDALAGGDDPVPSNGKYFVTYMGSNETLGSRDINSEIFRKRKGPDGRDLKQSMFVHRTLHGTDGEPPAVGEISSGWSRAQRDEIAKAFSGIEVPAYVTAVDTGGAIEYRYAYASDMTPEDRTRFEELEDKIAAAVGDERDRLTAEMQSFLNQYWSDRKPLTDRQMGVFNNCQMMIASDAAQVGLNWGNASDLVMYDSLFSPMNEWQRITRAARMLPPAIKDKLKPTFDKLGAIIDARGAEGELDKYDGNANGALAIVNDVLDSHPDLRQQLLATGMNPAAIAESFLAQRSIDRINALRGPVGQQLKKEGRVITSAPKVQDPQTGEMVFQTVKPQEITSTDVMNEIVEKHLKPFEKQILRSRKYLVDVKRLTTSVEVPETETVKVDDKTVTRPTGRKTTEHPSKAEKSVLMAGRAKQVPMEKYLGLMQQEMPVEQAFDFLPVTSNNLSTFAKPDEKVKSEEQKEKERQRREEYKKTRAAERAKSKALKEQRRKEKAERKAAERAAKQTAREAKAAEKAAKRQQKKDSAAEPAPEPAVVAAKSMRPARRVVFYSRRKSDG